MKVENTNNSSPDECFFSDKQLNVTLKQMSPSVYINLVLESER